MRIDRTYRRRLVLAVLLALLCLGLLDFWFSGRTVDDSLIDGLVLVVTTLLSAEAIRQSPQTGPDSGEQTAYDDTVEGDLDDTGGTDSDTNTDSDSDNSHTDSDSDDSHTDGTGTDDGVGEA